MRGRFVRNCRTGTGILAGTFLLAACTSGIRVTPADSPIMPLAVPVVPEDQDGTRINQWGGIVPDAIPTVPIDDGALGEVDK